MKRISYYQSRKARGALLDSVYSLRYIAYREDQSIPENTSKRFSDEFDSAPYCTSYLAYDGSKPAGSIRSCVYAPGLGNKVPVMDVFGQEIAASVGFDKIFVESNKFVLHPDFQGKSRLRLMLQLFGNIVMDAKKNNADYIVTAVRESHLKFYEKHFFEVISKPKIYPELRFETVLMLCRDVRLCLSYLKKYN